MLLLWLIKLLMNDPMQFLIVLAILILPLLVSVTIHEWAHGMTAYLFGDPTPKRQGRLSFNPFAHLDPIGTLMLFIIGIGWAKPVEINPDNIHGKTKLMLVALAGPGSNFLLAIFFSLINYAFIKYSLIHGIDIEGQIPILIISMLKIIVQINIILCLFNMMPIPPLDGSNVLKWFMPENIAAAYSRLAPYGMFIILLLLFTVGFKFIFVAAKIVERHIYNIIEYIMKPLFGLM
ncbi:MAG: site-2 protease family protein [Candidatus Gastranaerophilales bacterium]|nr:site-2 protease family protein [Candidatus Gastranaerophilales bacterium]